MKLLVLGGTVFLGRHFVEAALAAGHRVTLFHRGRSGAGLFPQAERVLGDRAEDLGRLAGRTFDAVLDTSGFLPPVVSASVEALSGRVGLYAFVSTVSVYADWGKGGDEGAAAVEPLMEAPPGTDYGRLKAGCERVVLEAPRNRALVVRPGLIVGPHDPTDRFTYWPARLARGGEVLAPGRPGRKVQVIDGRDLAEWLLRCMETGATGVYNACGPGRPMSEILEACRDAASGAASLAWVSDEFLVERRVEPYTELPLWIPGIDDNFSAEKAVKAGLGSRPLARTIADTLSWDRARPPDAKRRHGLSAGREAELLADWRGARR